MSSTSLASSFSWRHVDPKIIKLIASYMPPSRRHYLRKGCHEWNQLLIPLNWETLNPYIHMKKNADQLVQKYAKHLLKAEEDCLFSYAEYHRYIIGASENLIWIEFCGIPEWSKYCNGNFRQFLNHCEDRINWQYLEKIILSTKHVSQLKDWTYLNEILDRQILANLNEIRLKGFDNMVYWASTFPLRSILEKMEINCETQDQFDQIRDLIPRFPSLHHLRITLSSECKMTWADLMVLFNIIKRLDQLDSFHLIIENSFDIAENELANLHINFNQFHFSKFREFIFLIRFEDEHAVAMDYLKRLVKEGLSSSAQSLRKLHLTAVDTEILSLISVQCPNLVELVSRTPLPKPFTLFTPMTNLKRFSVPAFSNAALNNPELIHKIMPNVSTLWLSYSYCDSIQPPHWHEVPSLFPNLLMVNFCTNATNAQMKKLSERNSTLPWVKVSIAGIDYFGIAYLRKIMRKCPDIVSLVILRDYMPPSMKTDSEFRMFPNVEVFSATFNDFIHPFERFDIRLINKRSSSQESKFIEKFVKPFTKLFIS